MDDIRAHIKDYSDKDEIEAYLRRIVDKDAFDQKGLIYGMGHAVYSISDPRERVFKDYVKQLAEEKKRQLYHFLCPNEMIWTSNKRNPKIIGATLRNVNEYWKTE